RQLVPTPTTAHQTSRSASAAGPATSKNPGPHGSAAGVAPDGRLPGTPACPGSGGRELPGAEGAMTVERGQRGPDAAGLAPFAAGPRGKGRAGSCPGSNDPRPAAPVSVNSRGTFGGTKVPTPRRRGSSG